MHLRPSPSPSPRGDGAGQDGPGVTAGILHFGTDQHRAFDQDVDASRRKHPTRPTRHWSIAEVRDWGSAVGAVAAGAP